MSDAHQYKYKHLAFFNPSLGKINSMIDTISQLKTILRKESVLLEKHRVAVGSLIFTQDDKVVLLERGSGARDAHGKMEGVGGGLDESDQNLHHALLREIREEIGPVKVSIDEYLGYNILPGEEHPHWVIVDYLCRLKSGTPKNMEPDKCTKIHYLSLSDIQTNLDKLSIYQQATMKKYFKKFRTKPYV